MKQLQMDGIAEHADQNQTTENWLHQNGLQPKMKTITFNSARGTITNQFRTDTTGATGANGPGRLIKDILDTGESQTGFKKIGFSGQMAGHTVAAYVDDEKGVTFFAPNFGEFHFPTKESFSD